MDRLLAMLDGLPESYGVLKLRCEIPGHPSFFPGGRGYKGRLFPKSPIMFVGHNFDTEHGFRKSVARGHEDYVKMKTWVNMRGAFLPKADISEEDCFFTNFYLGAIIHPEPEVGQEKKKTNTGTFKCSRAYKTACISALRTQVEIVRPRVIALLGNAVPSAFAKAFPVLGECFIDDIALLRIKQPAWGFRVQLLAGLDVQVICLVHPANPRSLASHQEQGALLAAAVRAARR